MKKTASILEPLREVADLIFADNRYKVNFTVPENLWPVDVDLVQIGQAFHNLLLNAKEAMPQGGRLNICLENINLAPDQIPPLRANRYVKITIQDWGSGIAPEHLVRVFDPYFTTKPRGNGLGLATTHSIITRHDGHISVASESGVGTTFTLYLPASENSIVVENETTPPEPVVGGHGRILLMDDEDLIREATGALLEHLGYEYVTAKDGSEAIEIYRDAMQAGQSFDVVILDLTVPGGMGGRESIKQLLDLDPTVKAVVSSGYFHDPVVANYKAHGFSGVVSKPYTIEEMGDTLHHLIHQA